MNLPTSIPERLVGTSRSGVDEAEELGIELDAMQARCASFVTGRQDQAVGHRIQLICFENAAAVYMSQVLHVDMPRLIDEVRRLRGKLAVARGEIEWMARGVERLKSELRQAKGHP